MEVMYDWNNEVILLFYSTLYLDEKSSKLFWMTEDKIYSVSLVSSLQFLVFRITHVTPRSYIMIV
jgi:hypothetical protein